MDPGDLVVCPSGGSETLGASACGASATEGAQIAHRLVVDGRKHGILEPSIVAQQDNEGAGVRLELFEHLVRPGDDELVDVGESLGRCPGSAGVGDDDLVAELGRHLRQRLRDVARPEDQQARLGRHGLDEDLAVAVLQRAALLVGHELFGVITHVIRDILWHLTRDVAHTSLEQRLGTHVSTGHHRGDGSESLPLLERPKRSEDLRHHFSMNTWIVPPQVKPTSKASSSAIPYVMSFGSPVAITSAA